jgi:Spy/CpxP family protein refolding chaperone
MKRFVTVALAVVFVFAVSVMAFAEDKAPCGKMGKENGMGMSAGFMMGPKMILSMASELNLTTDQMDKIKKIADGLPKKGDNKDEMKKDRDAIKEEMDKDSPDEAKIVDIMTKIADKRVAAMKTRIHTELAVRAVLTKDQIAQLKKMREDRKEKTKSKGNWKDKSDK